MVFRIPQTVKKDHTTLANFQMKQHAEEKEDRGDAIPAIVKETKGKQAAIETQYVDTQSPPPMHQVGAIHTHYF
jgi:hypothetical protein